MKISEARKLCETIKKSINSYDSLTRTLKVLKSEDYHFSKEKETQTMIGNIERQLTNIENNLDQIFNSKN